LRGCKARFSKIVAGGSKKGWCRRERGYLRGEGVTVAKNTEGGVRKIQEARKRAGNRRKNGKRKGKKTGDKKEKIVKLTWGQLSWSGQVL